MWVAAEGSKSQNRLILSIASALILAAISLSLPWYRVRTDDVVQHYFLSGAGSDDSLANSDNVLSGMYLWILLGWCLLIAVIARLRRTTIAFGWLAMASSVVTLAYFVSEASITLSPGDFMGSGFDEFNIDVELVWGPSTGWFLALVAAAVQTVVVLLLMYDLFAKESEPSPEPFE